VQEERQWTYHEICKWCPYKPDTVADIAKDMAENGYRHDRPIVVYEGQILDGRHRYEAALKTGTEFSVVEFEGSWMDAVKYVASENINRRHMSSAEKDYFYVSMANAIGVQSRGGDRKSEYAKINGQDYPLIPSQQEHAANLGVSHKTVKNWEADRKVIFSNPEMAAKVTDAETYREVKRELRKATKEEAEKIAKLKNLGDSSESEAANVDRQLEKFRSQGIDVDAVASQKDFDKVAAEKDKAREEYFAKVNPRRELAAKFAKILVDNKDYGMVAANAIAAYPRDGELEKAYEIILQHYIKKTETAA
jgi:transcriptional regulator with XRE-family HTH domain